MTLWRSDSDGAIALSILKHEIEGIKVKCPYWASGLAPSSPPCWIPASLGKVFLTRKAEWGKGVWTQIITRSKKNSKAKRKREERWSRGLSACLWLAHRATIWNRIHGEVSRRLCQSEKVQGASVLSTSWRPHPRVQRALGHYKLTPQGSIGRRTVRTMTSSCVPVHTFLKVVWVWNAMLCFPVFLPDYISLSCCQKEFALSVPGNQGGLNTWWVVVYPICRNSRATFIRTKDDRWI